MKGLQKLSFHHRWDDSLAEVFAFLEEPMKRVEEILWKAVQSPVQSVTAMALHLLSASGKRLRPSLTLLSSKLAGEINDRAILFAAAIELMHTATLIHDDVIDKADMRRGRTTIHTLWGNEAAVMCGDFLYAAAFNILAEESGPEVIKIMAKTSSQICEGEILELQLAFNPKISEEQCIEIARLKTAELMATACKIGAMASGTDDRLPKILESFGRNLGIAFQIVDDVLDIEGSIEEIGKPVGSDLLEGKITLPVRLILNALPEREREIWEHRISNRIVTSQDVAVLAKFAVEKGILEQARKVAQGFVEKALEQLRKLDSCANSSEAINLLEQIAHFSAHRRI